MNMMESVAHWSDLPPEMVAEIAKKLTNFEDFTALRGVCTWWRAAAAEDFFHGVKLPLLMLAQNEDDDSHEREFYSLSRKTVRKAAVPEAKGKACMDVRFGWIVAVSPSNGELYLFKPFSSSQSIPLPNFRTFPDYRTTIQCNPEYMCVRKAILSANPSDTSDFTVFVFFGYVLGFWKSGDEKWTRIKSHPKVGFSNIGFCGHKMYAIDIFARLWSWDPSATDLTQLHLVLTFREYVVRQPWGHRPYMVESTAGGLLVIMRNNTYFCDYWSTGTTYFTLYRIDVAKQQWEEIDDIGKDAIFIGRNASVSVSAHDFPGVIKPNCIYFTDDCVNAVVYGILKKEVVDQEGEGPNFEGGGKDMGIFHIEEGRIERFGIKSICPLSPPFWVFP